MTDGRAETAERERDEARAGAAAMREALAAMRAHLGHLVDGMDHDDEECPGDDTCRCRNVAAVNAIDRQAMDALAATAGRDELERRQQAEAWVGSLTSDVAQLAQVMGLDGWEFGMGDILPRVARLKAKVEATDALIASAPKCPKCSGGGWFIDEIHRMRCPYCSTWRAALKAYEEMP